MKNRIVSIVAVTMVFAVISCNQASNKNNDQPANNTAGLSDVSAAAPSTTTDSTAPAAGNTPGSGDAKTTTQETKRFSVAPIVTAYLALKNALVEDNGSAAADAGKKLLATFKGVDMKGIPADQHKGYMDIADDAMENSEHIGDNAGKIEHQREHLASLSKDMNDLIALFGAPQKLYQDKCPMFNEGKGAIWISETREIKNPYYGSKMISCGSVKKEYQDAKKD
ncbi:DUF3347 domain-containing protein [Niabella sp. CC-SYL272]|uniref:DUF3347 domain-containing protein n=1 Tax=Niabella agricola TaxID=2891571 RepID=UPI001F396362|nr:DUF3347 domain-containing protein [Niabella agricola]MCF3107565.1 DUF3347 domain-containing protein [Niabella agricola]